jgi:hypothetical protein
LVGEREIFPAEASSGKTNRQKQIGGGGVLKTLFEELTRIDNAMGDVSPAARGTSNLF